MRVKFLCIIMVRLFVDEANGPMILGTWDYFLAAINFVDTVQEEGAAIVHRLKIVVPAPIRQRVSQDKASR